MLGKDMLLKALDHRRWATARIFDAAAQLSDDEYRADTGYGQGGLHSLLFHVVRVDNVWRNVIEAPERPVRPLAPEDFPDLAAIRAAWEREDAALTAYVAAAGEDELAATIVVRHPHFGTQATVRAYPLMQALMHALQHRAEAAHILTGHGRSPGDLDFIFTEGVFAPAEG
jgi:uncharacterized damage-inducible protein DinB